MSTALGDFSFHSWTPEEMNILILMPGSWGCWLSKSKMSCTKTYFLLFNIQLSGQQIRMTKTIAISGQGTTCIIENASHLEITLFLFLMKDQ